MRIFLQFRYIMLLSMVSACTEDVPSTCSPDIEGDLQSMMSWIGGADSDIRQRVCVDIHVASRRDATTTSPGRDNSFALSRAEVVPWTNITYEDAALACGRAGKFLCEGDMLNRLADAEAIRASVPIVAVPRTSDVVTIPEQPDINFGESSAYAFPESISHIVVWAADQTLRGAVSQKGGLIHTASIPIYDYNFKHPLVGFRCCIDARLQDAFDAFAPDAGRIQDEVDNVPIAE